jgi:hypothetical protein
MKPSHTTHSLSNELTKKIRDGKPDRHRLEY